MSGGTDGVATMVWQSITPELKALQGKVITRKELDQVRTRQEYFEIWPWESGYLDYITDDRSSGYWRPYVGQASQPGVIIHQHLTAAAKNNRETLHYYILSQGQGKRAMNYIRLWSLPAQLAADAHGKQTRLLLNNILETLMCRAFQSLPKSELKLLFGESAYSTLGLNVLPPFLQGVSLSISTRVRYVDQAFESVDDEIRAWPMERKRQRAARRNGQRKDGKNHEPYWPGFMYLDAVKRSILESESSGDLVWKDSSSQDEPHSTDITSLLLQDGGLRPGPRFLVTRPFGTVDARVGVVLDPCPVIYSENTFNIQESIKALPSSLIQANFTESNCLVWTVSVPPNHEHLKQFHTALIRSPKLRVILLAGPNAEGVVIGPELERNRTVIQLRGCTFPAYLETNAAKTEITRIYVRLSASLAVTSRCESWEETKEHAEAFRFAANVTETADIYGFTIASWLVGKEIILRYWSERENLTEPMTISSITPRIHEWFSLKGITTDQDIRLFEDLGGSLSRGAFLLLCTLPP
ncbi:hypothetical protein BJY00DRAFT_315683 [Aspergillus carlsbadensis]|nr:hypothetical protein BJY00DRAFT_315683 [Aspergillus carlsbadensis]